MNPLALRHRALPPEDIDFRETPLPAHAGARAFLIGVREGFAGPSLQSMRVIMVLPGQRAQHAGPLAANSAPRERIALETVQAAPAPETLRPIAGDVLRDAQGRLFERLGGDALRVLHRVLAGPRGELYEWHPESAIGDHMPHPAAAPARRPQARRAPAKASRARAAESSMDGLAEAERSASAGAGRSEARRRRSTLRDAEVAPRASTAKPKRLPLVRALLPPPGKWVQVGLGEFLAQLQGQLAHPARIAADYEIGAWLQVFDSDAAVDAAEAARQVFGDAQQAARFAPWSTSLAQRLGVTIGSQLGNVVGVPAPAGHMAAGQRFFALAVASDPTLSPAPQDPAAAAPELAARTTVPSRLQAALPTPVPRERALAQLQHAMPCSWWKRWRQRVSAQDRQAWQHRLAGHALDEQLWLVPPPPHGLRDPQVREWAIRTLRLAGYDATRMNDEWDIHWRCRGAVD